MLCDGLRCGVTYNAHYSVLNYNNVNDRIITQNVFKGLIPPVNLDAIRAHE